MYLRPSEVQKIYKISHTTLFDLEKKELLKPDKTPGGHRRYLEEDIKSLLKSGLRDSIGYCLEIHFHNYQPMPTIIRLIGYTKPSNNVSCSYCSGVQEDIDKLPILDLGKYRRVAKPYVFPKAPVLACPWMTVYLQGDQNTEIVTVTDRFCRFIRTEEGIELRMQDIMAYLNLDDQKWSDELPCYFVSAEVANDKYTNTMTMIPIFYELECR